MDRVTTHEMMNINMKHEQGYYKTNYALEVFNDISITDFKFIKNARNNPHNTSNVWITSSFNAQRHESN